MKGNIDEVKRGVEQVMCALNNLLSRQKEDHKASLRETAHVKTIGTLMDNNPLLGFIPGYKSIEANVT